MTEPICYVMVGMPALGKSYFVEKLSDQIFKDGREVWIYSTDMYIDAVAEESGMTYNQAFEANIKAATDFNNRRLTDILSLAKTDIIWDQTNLGVGKRKRIINRMKDAGYRVECLCITPPEVGHFDDLKVWKTRLNSREGKVIPPQVLGSMIDSYVKPTMEEGFDDVKYYNMYGHEVKEG